MKHPIATLALLGGLAGASQISLLAASFDTYGPWTTVGSFQTSLLDLPSASGSVEFTATFSASGTFRAADGTPNNSLESYTLTYASVVVSLSSANGILSPDPVSIIFNNVGVVVNYLTPATGTPGDWADIAYTISPVTQTIQVPYAGGTFPGTEAFTVDWTSLSAFSVTGGKGVASFTENPVLSGSLNVVPEPSDYAMVTGAGLLVLAGLRTRKR